MKKCKRKATKKLQNTESQSTIFKIIFFGQAEYPEDDSNYGTYLQNAVFNCGQTETLIDAITIAEKIYMDEHFIPSIDMVSFRSKHVEITDRKNRLVVAGLKRTKKVQWIKPIYQHQKSEFESAQTAIKALEDEANEASRCDSYVTAQELGDRANLTSLCLASDFYKTNKIVNKIARYKIV